MRGLERGVLVRPGGWPCSICRIRPSDRSLVPHLAILSALVLLRAVLKVSLGTEGCLNCSRRSR